MLASLIDEGLLTRADGTWTMRELPEGFLLPDTVQAVVAARVDLLAPRGERSAAGRVRHRAHLLERAVYELCPGLTPDLRQLEQRDFVRLSSGSSMEGEREYVFKHARDEGGCLREHPDRAAARLHASFADWVDGMPERRDGYAPILAHHYAQAVRPEDADLAWGDEEERLLDLREKAIGWLRRASELALGRYEIDEGLALLDSALALEPARPIQSAIWHEIGRAHALRYDGEPFAEAMQTAIELSDDPVEIADMYSDLARESLLRVGMWRQTPNPDRIETWIERAVELMPADGPTRAKVLIAQALWSGSTTDAEEASAIAEETGDPNLRFSALAVRSSVAFRERDYEDSLLWFRRAFELSDTVSDPELVADPDLSAVWPALALGHFDDARQLGMQVHDMNLGLTPHHRVHAVAVPMEVEELLGDWAGVRRMRAEAEAAVEANLETPCVRNPRSILLCALAEEIAGDSRAANALLDRAAELRMEGHGLALAGPHVRLELLRGDLDAVRRLLGQDDLVAKRRTGYHLGRLSIRLDALAALRERALIEEEAPDLLSPGTYLEPFALRALGIAREDESLLEQADERFRALGLTWHAGETAVLHADSPRIARDDTIAWLLDGDPAIRWQVMRDLLDEPAAVWEAERQRTVEEGWVAELLGRRGRNGEWPAGRWTASTWTLLLLVSLGIPERHPSATPALDRLLDRFMPPVKPSRGRTC